MYKQREIEELIATYPLLQPIIQYDELFWINPKQSNYSTPNSIFTYEEIEDAELRLDRFAPYIKKAFPETKASNGIIESNLKRLTKMKKLLEETEKITLQGHLFLKCDHKLPVSGSIKARGGIYEVLKRTESLLMEHGLLSLQSDYACLLEEKYTKFLSQYSIVVGSTGNLGLSIGLMGRKLGFNVIVHMSSDAKEWKKQLLRQHGAKVIEHNDDYSVAVAQGRKEAMLDSYSYFIDDENSKDLFLGYSVAALRLKKQLTEQNIIVDGKHPLLVYLPCGVGGAPGGICFALKQVFGENVRCFFAEPTHSPAMFVRLYTQIKNIAVQQLGLDNRTEADGLAVGQASELVATTVQTLVDGCYTVNDLALYRLLAVLYETEGEFLEPSALAAMYGPMVIEKNNYVEQINVEGKKIEATHLVWATGGSLVPTEMQQEMLAIGKKQQKMNRQ